MDVLGLSCKQIFYFAVSAGSTFAQLEFEFEFELIDMFYKNCHVILD